MSLQDRIATPASKRRHVRALFATIADRYDLITILLSYGRDRHWKAQLVKLAAPLPGLRALDLATGTGDIAFALARQSASVIGLDVTPRMIELARRKAAQFSSPQGGTRIEVAQNRPVFLVGDMGALPFPPGSFDVVTTGYGLRNVPDLPSAIDEMLRVLKPSGRAISLDFNRPANVVVRAAYLFYLTVVGSLLGWALHRDPDTYRYIPASIRSYPGAQAVAQLMTRRGFSRVTHYRVLGGLMAIHVAVK
jgi:demethylmenaquinone methyltransferase/2-methoxy-6-polyprenyl-1,4-benzoquinol methylase